MLLFIFSAATKAPLRTRIAWGGAAGIPLGLLIVASLLTPSANGLGTHHQLGLPPCTVRVLWGVRCPACGMTTSWVHFAHGNWLQSLSVNTGGFFLATIGLVTGLVLLGSAVSGRRTASWGVPMLAVSLVLAIAVSLIDWTIRVYG